jgi:hypothetical protein
MDPLTHGLLGASLGQALSGPALGRRALAWGAVLGMAPDVDILVERHVLRWSRNRRLIRAE